MSIFNGKERTITFLRDLLKETAWRVTAVYYDKPSVIRFQKVLQFRSSGLSTGRVVVLDMCKELRIGGDCQFNFVRRPRAIVNHRRPIDLFRAITNF